MLWLVKHLTDLNFSSFLKFKIEIEILYTPNHLHKLQILQVIKRLSDFFTYKDLTII